MPGVGVAVGAGVFVRAGEGRAVGVAVACGILFGPGEHAGRTTKATHTIRTGQNHRFLMCTDPAFDGDLWSQFPLARLDPNGARQLVWSKLGVRFTDGHRFYHSHRQFIRVNLCESVVPFQLCDFTMMCKSDVKRPRQGATHFSGWQTPQISVKSLYGPRSGGQRKCVAP